MADVTSDNAALIGIYAALGYDTIAAVCSSPQTTEINASTRATTLMKWVNIGTVQAVGFGTLGSIVELRAGRPWWPPILGASLAAGLLYVQYVHARNVGLASAAPGTETW
jgi:hypothetical protein